MVDSRLTGIVVNAKLSESNSSSSSSASPARAKEDSLADMIDKALEKEFNETNEQSAG